MASKGRARPTTQVKAIREVGAEIGGSIDLDFCGARKVMLRSERTAAELIAMRSAKLEFDEARQVVLRRRGVSLAVVTSDVPALRRCIEQGVVFDADLTRLTSRGGLAVPVRPLASR